jgi:hypothetical protein
VTDQLRLFDALDAVDAVREANRQRVEQARREALPKPTERLGGAERLMRDLARRGLQREHAVSAAALVLELDAGATS